MFKIHTGMKLLFMALGINTLCWSDPVSTPVQFALPNPREPVLNRIADDVQSLVDAGEIIGAQLVVSNNQHILMSRNFGVRSVEDDTPIDAETMFCIGSCSKPIASAAILMLVDKGVLDLNRNIDFWLPAYGKLKTTDGQPSRAPNLAELLSHYGGIYSQRNRLTSRQLKWIRDFKLSLETSANGIAREPLIARPGELYAYSGAGYCVAGRVAEVAAKMPFEEILQANICKPLGLLKTTYFPSSDVANIATGSVDGRMVEASSPHLSRPFNLSLIGGSLYSTAEDCIQFLQTVLKQEITKEAVLMRNALFSSYTLPYRKESNSYGFGWSVRQSDKDGFVTLAHNGSLSAYKATFQIDRQTGLCIVMLYTVAEPDDNRSLMRKVQSALRPLMDAPKF